jgi:hypothetical protein
MRHARRLIAAWRQEYHDERPHSTFGCLAPNRFADSFFTADLCPFRTNWGAGQVRFMKWLTKDKATLNGLAQFVSILANRSTGWISVQIHDSPFLWKSY